MSSSEPGRSRHVLVVDDDPDARWIASDALIEHGYQVSHAVDGPDAEAQIEAHRPDLVILDLGLPGIDGLDVLQWIRRRHATPVIVLTARTDQSDRVVGLELGADDYVVKPFDARELVARANAVLRRCELRQHPHLRLDFDSLTIDPESRDVRRDGELVELTAKEFELLLFLARSPRQVFTREQLLDNVWHSSSEWQSPSTVNEHIHRLRRKLEHGGDLHRWIETMRGAGYRFSP